jgi:hydrogenase expression/formation protein HypE
MNEERIQLAHGGGGELTNLLLRRCIAPALSNPVLDPLTDGALLDLPQGRVCVTTDASVVQPLFFNGGDIGRLSVCGTVNDLSVMGARPLALTQSLILEEGLPLATLDRVMNSIATAAKEADVFVASGDTKVVQRSRGDGMFISTSGIGVVEHELALELRAIRATDKILVSGTIADHGLTIMAAREGLELSTRLCSDVAPLQGLCATLWELGFELRFLRDPTRGGLAGVLADLAEGSGLGIEVRELDIPLRPEARHASELLGLDPLGIANEGKVVVVCSAAAAPRALSLLRAHPLGRNAAVIGEFIEAKPPLVELITRIEGRRIVTRPQGEELPRIC